MTKKHQVFVYGTLKRGLGNHRFIRNGKFIKEHILKDHTLYEGWSIPFCVHEEGSEVKGEVHEINSGQLENVRLLEAGYYEGKTPEGYIYYFQKKDFVNEYNLNKIGEQYVQGY